MNNQRVVTDWNFGWGRASRAFSTKRLKDFQNSVRYSPYMDHTETADTYNALYYSMTAVFGPGK